MKQKHKAIYGRSIMVARYSPDGRYIAVAGGKSGSWKNDGFVSIYSAYSLRQIQEREHPFEVICLDWSPDGKRIAYGGKDGTVCIWNLAKGTSFSYYDHSPELVHLPSWSNPMRREVVAVIWIDNIYLASTGLDGFVRTWHSHSGETMHMNYYEKLPSRFVYAPGGIWAAASPYPHIERRAGAIIYDIEAGQARCSLLQEENVFSLGWAPKGTLQLATGSWHHISIWDVSTATQLLTFPCEHYMSSILNEPPLYALAWSPDASQIAHCARWNHQYASLLPYGRGWGKAVVQISSTTDGMMQSAYVVNEPQCLDWSPHGDQLVVGGMNGFDVLLS